MNRNLLTLLSLLAVIGWLFFNYAPQTWGGLPGVALPVGEVGSLFQVLALVVLLVFLLLQVILVWVTFRMGRPMRANELANGG